MMCRKHVLVLSRVEHLHFNADPSTYEIELEFLGKDSMLFKQTIYFNKYGDNGKAVYKCLQVKTWYALW
ncbi:hypothetical protein EON65_03500 [archaeon]|nr:MAG: hypothetical protein EON65_03500 [archaeon]